MYALSVTFDYDEDFANATDRVESFREYLETLPGLIGVEIYRRGINRFTVVSKWTGVEAAQEALSRPGVNDELALRIRAVTHPEAVELFSA